MLSKHLLLTWFLLIFLCNDTFAQVFTFDFSIDDQMFEGGVSDFSVAQSAQHEFTFVNRTLLSPLDTTRLAQFVSGINPSDDLFMFMKRKITGLQPNTTYHATIVVEFASPYPTNAIGVGGPPGEGVTMKAGLTLIEPDTLIENQGMPFVIMNIDKGNQANPGADMDTIGHVGVNDTTTVWALKTNSNTSHPFTFTTDQTGTAWLIIGTDSGFESKTELFYTKVTVDVEIFTGIKDIPTSDLITVYPNPSSGSFTVSSNTGDIDMIRIYDMTGRYFTSYSSKSKEVNFNLPASDYVIKIFIGNTVVVKRITVL